MKGRHLVAALLAGFILCCVSYSSSRHVELAAHCPKAKSCACVDYHCSLMTVAAE